MQENKVIAKVVARLKYTNLVQRTRNYEERATDMSRACNKRSFLEMARATPGTLTRWLRDDGPLNELERGPCPKKRCMPHPSKSKAGIAPGRRQLGKFICKVLEGPDISVKSASHRCQCCRTAVGVGYRNPLYWDFARQSSKGITYASLAFWNCSLGVPMTVTARQLRVNMETVLSSELY